ncbi:MAG: hypothetical protein EXR72_21445 [Myxococcales bacterium]|nr:hypothetical protein [Myxococcales bacterium]
MRRIALLALGGIVLLACAGPSGAPVGLDFAAPSDLAARDLALPLSDGAARDLAVPADLALACPGGCQDPLAPVCDPQTAQCVACVTDAHCRNDGGLKACCDHACVEVASDVANCGKCGKACPGGAACCGGACTDIAIDPKHCGACGQVCKGVANAAVACVQSACKVTGCVAPFSDCNMDPADGCEANLNSDVGHCTGCGKICTIPNGEGGCANGCFAKSCYAGFADCNKQLFDGCEVQTTKDPLNCGVCGKLCQPPANASAGCFGGACTVGGCVMGFGDCNNSGADGCEITLADAVAHCGKCGNACSFANANSTCANGQCVLGACKAGFKNCNANAADGCESESAKDPLHCGACATKCPAVANGAGGCANSVCGVGVCNMNFGDCDGSGANGCEANLLGDAKNCGMCGNVCPNNLANCSGGVCANVYTFVGVQKAVPVANLAGWTECHKETFAANGSAIAAVLVKCNKANLLIACRTANSATLAVAAHAPRADVTFVNAGNTPHDANGVGWYFSTARSWGFAKGGDPLSLNNCDTSATNPDLRMCWHTSASNITAGYRCGPTTVSGATYERLIYHAD